MSKIEGFDRDQLEFTCLDFWVKADSPARVIDRFVDSCVAGKVEFNRDLNRKDMVMGRPFYNDADLMKLYMYGYTNKIKSSRMLEKACENNVEVIWLMKGLRPDFRTIALFRKDNISQITSIFSLFNEFIKEKVTPVADRPLFGGGFYSADGTKVRAVQAKDGCFTASKIDDRIQNDKNQIARYESYLEDMDQEDKNEEGEKPEVPSMGKEEIEKRLEAYKDRLEQHETIRDDIEENGTQVSLYDPDARLMKNHYGGYAPSYNIQGVVASESHLIAGFNTTNNCSDNGLLYKDMADVAENDGREIVEVVADNGYSGEKDLIDCLENGIIPHVFPDKVKDENGNYIPKKSVKVSFPYEPDESMTDEVKASTKPEDIKRCLHAGVVPDCYKDCLSSGEEPEIETVNKLEYSDDDPLGIDAMSEEEKKALAAEGYFVRDLETDRVYCPQGCILRKKSNKKNGVVRYCNKEGCKRCQCQCFTPSRTTRWKEVDFSRNCRIKGCGKGKDSPKGTKAKKIGEEKRVLLTFTPDRAKLDKRKCLSEHPFGTIKRYMLGDHFLLRGLEKVTAETALIMTGYNLKRLLNIVPASIILERVFA